MIGQSALLSLGDDVRPGLCPGAVLKKDLGHPAGVMFAFEPIQDGKFRRADVVVQDAVRFIGLRWNDSRIVCILHAEASITRQACGYACVYPARHGLHDGGHLQRSVTE